jgi:hypothetical protein
MPLKLDRQKLRETRQASWLALDIAMVVLVLVNLMLIVFDTIYATAAAQQALAATLPAFERFYGERIHANFLFYDLVFVAIFLAEFCFQWVMAVRKQVYARWYFYPFLRWYDLVGCIPIGSLRMLRLLRVVSLLVRLQKMGVIDLTDTRPYRFLAFYFNVFIDEVSDRVIVRTLDDVRREIEDDSPVTRQVVREVIAPHRDLIVSHLAQRIGQITDRSYQAHQDSVHHYIESVVAAAVEANEGVRRLERVPVLGRSVVLTLRQSINDIVHEVFARTLRDISASENNRLVDETVAVLVDTILDEHPELSELGAQIAIDVIEIIKERVRVQHWKEALERRERETAQLA